VLLRKLQIGAEIFHQTAIPEGELAPQSRRIEISLL